MIKVSQRAKSTYQHKQIEPLCYDLRIVKDGWCLLQRKYKTCNCHEKQNNQRTLKVNVMLHTAGYTVTKGSLPFSQNTTNFEWHPLINVPVLIESRLESVQLQERRWRVAT